MRFERANEIRDRNLEPFTTDPIGGFPHDGQRLSNGLIVDPTTRLSSPRKVRTSVEDADRMLAVISTQLDELIEHSRPLSSSAPAIALPQSADEFLVAPAPNLPPHRVSSSTILLVAGKHDG